MKKLSIFGFICFCLAQAVLPSIAQAQNWTTVSATNITDLNQQKLPAGQLCFLATDQNDNPISIGVGGGGQSLRRQYCSQVTAGGVTPFTVPNPTNTLPPGVYYRVTVRDSSTGQEVLRYTQVSFAGTSFNFDNYAPLNLGTPAPISGNSVTGNLSVTGNISATGTLTGSNLPANILQQIFNSGTGLTQRTAFNMLAGITCSDNAGTSRTDCRLGTLNTLTFSATPVFDASTASAFKLTLTGNVTSSTLANAVAGEPLAFEICQDATGGRTFVPPANMQGWVTIPSGANACVMETFVHDGTNAVADGDTAGQVMAQDGAAATPSISFENNTNTGFYRIAANRVGLALNGLNSADFQNAITIFNSGTVKTNNYVLDINNADAGISRVAAGTLAFGNGTAGNSSGSMVANVWAQSPDAGATQHARLQPTGVEIGSADTYLVSSTTNASGSPDTGISRTGAAKIGFGNGTNGNTSGTMEGRAVQLDGATSGSVTLAVPAAAGANTWTIPAATDTAVGQSTTDTLKNKDLRNTGSGNAVNLLNIQGSTGALIGNSTDQTIFTYTIPSNTVGAGKGIRVSWATTHTAGTAAITYKLILGSTVYVNNALTDSGVNINGQINIFNAAGVQNSQIGWGFLLDGATVPVNASGYTSAENLANATTLKLTFNVPNTDQVTGFRWLVELIQ